MGRPNTAMPCSPVLSAVAGGVLRLQFLQTFHLIALQPTELLAPAVVRHLADTNRTDRLGHALALRGQNINLAQLGDDLLRLVALSRHRGPPWSKNHSSGWTTSLGADHVRRRRAIPIDPASRCRSARPARSWAGQRIWSRPSIPWLHAVRPLLRGGDVAGRVGERSQLGWEHVPICLGTVSARRPVFILTEINAGGSVGEHIADASLKQPTEKAAPNPPRRRAAFFLPGADREQPCAIRLPG